MQGFATGKFASKPIFPVMLLGKIKSRLEYPSIHMYSVYAHGNGCITKTQLNEHANTCVSHMNSACIACYSTFVCLWPYVCYLTL